jgi:hypothetical protein
VNALNFIVNKFQVDITSSPILLQYRRYHLGELFKQLGFSLGAEIGTDRGIFAETLCRPNPELHLYCIDPWKTFSGYDDFPEQAVLDANFKETTERLANYNVRIIRETSIDALRYFEDRSLDFVYIDANHDYDHVLEDVRAWSRKVKKGGIVSGHDYRRSSHSKGKWSVNKAVNAYLKENNIQKLFLIVKNVDSSWFFINE